MIRYLVLSNIAIFLYYILYKTLLQNDTFFSLKRLFFISALLFSMVFPFVWWAELCIETPDSFSNFSVLFLNNKANLPTTGVQNLPTQINWLSVLYSGCVGVLFLQFLVRLLSVFRIKRNAVKTTINGQTVYISSQKFTAFTFFSMIFIDEETAENEETLSLILRHESVHQRQLHSLDTIFTEIVCIFFFFNPFIWLLKKEIMLNLECIADDFVKQHTSNLSAYQYAIVNTTTHKTNLSFINQFNISNLQKRIIMLNKTTTNKKGLIKYFSIVPIAVGLLLTSHLSVAGTTLNGSEVLSVLNDKQVEKKKELLILEWTKMDIDLGEVPQGVPATATYEFVNKGKTPIIITNVKTSCGCTTKEYTKEPIPAGQKGIVKATYNAKNLGKFTKTITVTVNDKNIAKSQLRIRGIVVKKK
ncbi:MAG: hypothetical protein CSA94_01410 [Bacteroidetes bacterium]|nr:MAG: hypothetical protein CSA94_01410 [Bacteroidota bacterium]